jgi:hypothetical protein
MFCYFDEILRKLSKHLNFRDTLSTFVKKLQIVQKQLNFELSSKYFQENCLFVSHVADKVCLFSLNNCENFVIFVLFRSSF